MNFSVDSQILTNIGPNLSTIENEIKNSANAAYDIGKQMRLKSLASEILSLKLRSNARTIMSLADNVKSYRTALKSITQEYIAYEAAIREEFLPASGGVRRVRNLTQESGIFDDQGSYGGNQGDMIDNQAKKQILWWTIGGNQALYNAVRTYPKYADYTDDQIKDLFDKINGEGCGYVAMANAIFVQYHGDADAFERDFGFPMYDENGEYNFDRLLLDIYAETDDKYYLNEKSGMPAYARDVLKSYKGREDEFRKEYGVPLYQNGDNTRFNPAAQQAVLDRVGDSSVVKQEIKGLTHMSYENRLQHYLKEKNIPASCRVERAPSPKDVKSYLESGKSVTIIVYDEKFKLYTNNGSLETGKHGMTITGVTDDGRYVVSSWGDKYYLKPDELSDVAFEVIDLYV